MIKLGQTTLDGTPKIALVVSDRESNRSIQSSHPDTIEIRVDQFRSLNKDYVKAKLKERVKTRLPLILTIRNQVKEGASSKSSKTISNSMKWDLFEAGIDDVQAVDIELSSVLLKPVVRLAKKNKKIVIISSHHFQKTPSLAELENIFRRAKKEGAHIVKIAAQTKVQDDVTRLLKFTIRHKTDHVITLSMGQLGSVSRLVFPAAGSLLTYSFLDQPFAPGQIPLKTLQNHFRLYYPDYQS